MKIRQVTYIVHTVRNTYHNCFKAAFKAVTAKLFKYDTNSKAEKHTIVSLFSSSQFSDDSVQFNNSVEVAKLIWFWN